MRILSDVLTIRPKAIRNLILVWFFAMGIISAFGQTLPATVNTTVAPPYSVYLSDYLSTDSEKIRLIVRFNDLNEPSWDVKLKFTIQSNTITISTRPDFTPAVPITLTPGVPMMLTSADLAEYFNINNLTFSGITPNQINQNGRLPEDLYSFCFEVLDYRSGKPISMPGCSNVWAMMKEPPYVVVPQAGAVIAPTIPQNIPFTWQMANAIAPGDAFANEYQLTVYEVTDRSVPPLNAINNGKALKIYTSEWITLTTFLYDISASLLDVGKRYVFTVQVRDVDGRNFFKNDGFSQVSWFDYGYPEGGGIQLKEPLNNAAAGLNRPTQFTWSMPSNLIAGQRFKYVLNVVEIKEGQNESVAIETNESFATYSTPEMASSFDVLHLLNKPLQPMTQYAWQVRAYTGDQLIASSSVFRLAGPPVLEKFMAGNQEILVKSTSNADLTNLNGIALVKVSPEADAPLLEIPFNGLRIRRTSIQYVLDAGEVIHDLSMAPFELNPELEENQTALFYPEKIRITKSDFSLHGNIKWPFPHPVTSGERAFVKSESKWFNYSGYKLKGLAVLTAENTFELLDPYQFKLAFDQTSDFEVINNKYRLHLNGNVILSEKMKGQKAEPVKIPFILKDQLYYFTVTDLNLTNNIALMSGTTINLQPKRAIIDLSDKQSPLKLMATPLWKGLYFENFNVDFPKQPDGTNQLKLNETIVQNFTLDASSTTRAWATGAGLTCDFRHDFLSSDVGTFNKFPSVMNSIAFKMVDSSISDSELKGSIKIPVIDDTEDFSYTIPLADNGFQTGFLDQSLEETSFIFNPYGIENKVELVIKRAVFAENERLDLTVDITIPYINALLTSVADFRAYGDYSIGFGKRNGGIHLDNHVEASYDGFTMFIDQVAASFLNGNYAFSYSATMPLGEEVAGNEGPPRVNIHSVEKGGALVAEIPSDPSAPSDLPPPEDMAADNGTLKFDSVSISISSAIVDLSGYLKVTKDDPKWGTSFQGGIKGTIKIPTQIDAGANLILGDKNKVKYWYFDAWFIDHQGMGLSVFNMFNLVAFEGKVYRHMELDLSKPSNGSTPNLIVNPEVKFGAGLYMQLVDKTGGKQFMSDIGAEIVVKDQGFIVAMEGDISAINDNGRNTAVAGQLRSAALKQAAAEAAKKAVQELGEINVNIPVGGGNMLGVKASGQGGGLSYSSGDLRVAVDAQVANVPGGTLSVVSGPKEITVSGNADAQASLLLKDGSNQLGLNIEGKNGGSLNLAYDAFNVETAFNKAKGSASMMFRYGDKLIDVAANKQDGNGHLALEYGERKRMYLALDRAGKGEFEFQYDDNLVGISGDSETGSGALRVEVGQNTVAVEANKSEGTGSLLVQSGATLLSINASKAGAGALRLTDGEKLFAVKADKTAGTGELELKFASDKRMFLAADRAGKGEMEFEYGPKFFRIAADKTIGMGELKLRDGSDKYFNVYVNRSENVGNVGFRYGQDSVMAMMDGDTSAIQFVLQNKRMGVGVHRAGKGGLVLQDGDRLFEIMADKTQGSGSLRLEDGAEKRIFVSANKSAGTGAIQLAYNNNSLEAEIAPDHGALSFDINNTAFNVSASSNGSGELGFRQGDRSFDVALSKTSGSFSLKDGDRFQLAIDPDKTLRFKDGSREIVLSASDPANSSIRDGNRTIALTPDETGARSYKTKIDNVDVTFRIGTAGKTISFTRTGTTFEIGLNPEGYGKINLTINGITYSALQENSNTFTLTDGSRSFTVSGDKTLTFREGPTKSVSISSTEVALVYDGRNLSFGREKYISYSDTDRSFDLGADGLSITEGSKTLSLTSDKQLILKDGTTRSLNISAAGLILQNEGMEIAVGSDKSFRYSDAERNFTLNTQGVEIVQGDKSMALVNSDAGLGLQLKDGTRSLSFSRNQVTLADGNNNFTLGGEQYLALAYQGKNISVGDGFISYAEGDRKIAFGGENFVELKDGDRLLAITKQKVFTLADGDKSVSIGADKTFSITDGVRTIALGGTESIVRYSDSENTISVQAAAGTYGFSVARPEVTVSASTQQFKKATLAVSTTFGSISITGDASKNIDATFARGERTITITGGKKRPSIKDSAEEEKPEPVLPEVGTQAPDMAGPQYIGKVTDNAKGGRVKGNIKFYYNSIESHLIANASVASIIAPCLSGALTVESRGSYWRVDIGTEQQMIRVFPSCSGFGGGGWLGIDPQNLSIGVFAGFNAGGEVKIDFGIGWAKIGAKIEAELGIKAKAQLEPQFIIKEAGVWVRLYAGVYVKYDVGLDSGTINIAEAELKGTLTFYFTDGTRMVGTLDGYIKVIGIGADFSMGFDQRF